MVDPRQKNGPSLASGIDRRAFLTRSTALGLALSVPGSLLAGCGGGVSSSNAKAGGTLRIGLGASRADGWIESLDPAFNNGEADTSATMCIFQGLMQFKPNTNQKFNALAESVDTSADGKQIKFVLRRGAQFQHGYGEVTAEDVKTSYERVAGLIDKSLGSYYTSDFTNLERVDVTGRYEGVLQYSSPYAPTFTATLPSTDGLVAPKQALEKLGKKFGLSPVGSGPYQVASSTQQEVVLERFPEYDPSVTGIPRPWFDEIRLINTPDANAVKTSLVSGALDWAAVSAGDLVNFEGADLVSHRPPSSLFFEWISMNVKDPVLQDLRVRQAIRYAIDVPGILDAAFNNKTTRANAILPPGVVGHWDAAPVYDRDVEKARSLLAAAGQGAAKLTFTTGSTSPGPTIAQIVQSNLKDVGLQCNIHLTEPGSGGGPSVYPTLQLSFQSFSATPDPSLFTVNFRCGQAYNTMQWCNPEYTRLDKLAADTLDEAQRAQMYLKMQQLMDDDAVAVWIDWPVNWWEGVKNVQPAFTPYGDFLGVYFRGA